MPKGKPMGNGTPSNSGLAGPLMANLFEIIFNLFALMAKCG
jgi:hypothetical protein